jgi:hypothetical protein
LGVFDGKTGSHCIAQVVLKLTARLLTSDKGIVRIYEKPYKSIIKAQI